jgi:hypothetical protein
MTRGASLSVRVVVEKQELLAAHNNDKRGVGRA